MPTWFTAIHRSYLFKYSSNGYFSSQSGDEPHAAVPLLSFVHHLLNARPSLAHIVLDSGLLDVLLKTRINNSPMFYAYGLYDRESYIAFCTIINSTLGLLSRAKDAHQRLLTHPISIMWPELIGQPKLAVYRYYMISLESQQRRITLWRSSYSNLIERRLSAIDEMFRDPSVEGVSDYMGICVDLTEFST